ncbi:MAG: TRAP transporter substrate-binding protein [Betaproteobacteria bacterium]|nr:TRAP transporter substrate-binding protein [Betaproteobacteria bacterium]
MKGMHRLAVAAAVAGAFGALAVQPAAADTTLTMSSWVPPSHPLTSVFLVGWAKEAEKVTGGRVKFQMLPKAPVAPPGTFDAVHEDLVDLSYVTASYTPARFVLTRMAELPGGGPNATINSLAYSKIHWEYFQKVGEYKGVHLLGVFTHGPGQIFNSKRPINGVNDLNGLKIRTGGGVADDMGKAFGASLLFKPAPQSYELLKEGVADGVFFPLESPHSFHLEKLIHYATIFPHGFYYSSFGFFMNEDKWNKLPQQDKDALDKISKDYVARAAGKMWDDADAAGLAAIKEAGVQITYASPAFEKAMQEKAQPIIQDWIKAADVKGVDGKKALDAFHAEVRRLEQTMKK